MELEYRWGDVFKAGRLGFNTRKIGVGVKGLFWGALFYSIFSYGALWISGTHPKAVWQAYRLIPAPFVQGNLNWIGIVLYIIACLFALFFYLITLTAISKITFEQLKGDEFYEGREAWAYARKNWKAVFVSPLFLPIIIAILILTGLVMGLLIKIPLVGPILIGLLSFPLIAGAAFIVYLSIVACVVLIAAPAIIAATDSDTFDTVFEGFSLINSQTWRFLLWETILFFMSLICVFVLAYLIKMALGLTHTVIGRWAGEDLAAWKTMWKNAKWFVYLPNFFPLVVAKWFPSLVFAQSAFISEGVGKGVFIGSILMGASFYLILFIVLAYGLSVLGSGQTLIYTILVKIKDSKDLLEEKEDLFGEEFEDVEEPEEKEKKPKKK
jgi:hypothetical protein